MYYILILFRFLCLADNKGRWWIVGSAWKGDEHINKTIKKKE